MADLRLRTRRFGLHAWRNGLHLLGQACWVYALSALPLATVFAIEFTSPIWTAVLAMLLLGERLNRGRVVMLALGFLLIIGLTLIADGFGHHVPKGYIYTAMAFSAGVEALNMMARKRRARLKAAAGRSA